MAQYELRLSDYWRILRKRFWVIVGSGALILTTTGLYLNRQTPVYRAEAKIKLEKPRTVSGNIFQGFQSYYENPIASEARVIESRSIAEEVLRRLDPAAVPPDPLVFQARVDQLQGSLRANPIPETNIIGIIATGTDPHQVAQIANLTAEAYITFNLQERNKQARKVREFIESQLTQVEVRLKVAEDKLRHMREQGTATGIATALEGRILDLQTQLTNLLPKLTGVHPDVIRLKEQLAQMEAQLQSLPVVELEYARMRRDIEVNEKTYRTLRERLEEARIAEAEKIADASIIERATVPHGPMSPRKRLGLAVGALLGLFVGCVVAFVVETLDTSIGTIEDVESLLQAPVLVVIPHFGREPRWQHRGWRLLWIARKKRVTPEDRQAPYTHAHPHSSITEAFRILRTNLKFSPERKVLLITSAGPREGKTTLVTNLGIVSAHSGAKTLLVSSDLRKPELATRFGLSREQGLVEVLRGDVPFEQAVQGLSDFILGTLGYDDVIKNPYLGSLFILTTGKPPDNPVDLLGSTALQELLGTLRAKFDVVLLDAPPLLPVADSLLLASKVDGVVLVYEVGRVSRAALLRAKVQLESAGGKLVGIVLNHVQPEVHTQPGYDYYQKRYAYREKEAAPVTPAPPAR